ncbi:PREDICTED: secreted protein C10orf99 homolog [Dipodomys ordii]|uniref:Secreted protein C10orf99 homolog n=1 Tax=Dipodomys ordii TaxID=10020 RepID=A0A1S3GFC4_DIPOR|nr:PREDICTED: secreted protein C10orf99 homolog [Dipodomys ordii]
MRLLVLSSLLFVLLLCFSVFSLEGRRHFAKPGKLRFCCRLAPSRNQTTQKGYREHAVDSQDSVLKGPKPSLKFKVQKHLLSFIICLDSHLLGSKEERNRMKVCRVCKVKAVAQPWVVPGALPQV